LSGYVIASRADIEEICAARRCYKKQERIGPDATIVNRGDDISLGVTNGEERISVGKRAGFEKRQVELVRYACV